MLQLLAKAFLLWYAMNRLQAFLKARKGSSVHVPNVYSAFQPMSIFGVILPASPFYRILGFNWYERHTLYKDAPLKTVQIVGVVAGEPGLYTASLDGFYQSLALNSDFHKGRNQALEMLGDSVLTTTGDDWKRHRRITAPSFNHATYRNVWETTVRVYRDMLDSEGWRHVDRTPVTNANKATHKLALFLVAIVGFGIPMSWNEPPRDDNGKLSAQSMIFDVATYIVERNIMPRFAYHLGIEKLKHIEEAYNRFEEFMHEHIASREAQLMKLRAIEGEDAKLTEGLDDIFGRLVNARLSEGKNSISDREIIGNCFAFTFAGHETTANTLAATLGLLALYQDEQDWVYKSIIEVLGDSEPTFDDFDKLDGVLACFYEGLRLFPAGYMLVKVASKDTSLSLTRKDNPEVKEAVPVRKGTPLFLDITSMCYDPQSFPEPEVFRPQRWKKSGKESNESTSKATHADEISGTSPATTLEGFIGFAYGPRTCIGHKFAKVEAVAFLTLLLREWRVEAVMLEGESKEAWRRRVLEPRFGQALLIGEVPVRLVRRE